MANLLSNTTIGGYQSIHTGNIGSYALTSLPSHNHDDRYFTETESDGRFQPLENQRLSTGNSPTFADLYNNGWFRNYNNYGLYNQTHGNHFYATSNNQWTIAANGSTPQIVFRSGGYEGTIRGFVYADTSNQIGFLNNAGDWSLRTNSSKDTQIYGALTVGSGTSADIYMTDTDESTRRIHTNSGRIGFLNSSSNWGAYCDNTGNWFSDHSMRAPIFYDSADTGYYLDPNGTTNIWRLQANDKYHYFGGSSNWDNGNLNGENSVITNVHFQGHPDFWIGAGNTKWYTSVASGHHDLLINTMQSGGSNTRGITFTASSSGGSVYRLGRWFAHSNQVGSYLNVDGGIKIGGTTDTYSPPVAKLQVISSTAGSDVFAVDGVNGRLFTVTDDLTDSLFSVNTIAGLPVIEAFADNTVKIGKYGSNSITISDSKIAINSDIVDSNFPFFVGDRSVAGARYSLTNKGMGFNLADNYAQLQLYGGNGSYIDFVTSSGQDSAGRIMWDGNFNIQGTTYFANNIYTYTLYDRNDTGYYLDMNGTSRLGTLNINQLSVYGNTYLGDGNGDEVHINDILRVGATDSGDAHFYFGEGGSAGSDYGSHWYWDSGYRFTWYTRNAGTDSTLFYYDTNSLSYITWGRSISMNNNSIDYTGQLHFNGGTRFQSVDTHYLKFRTDATDYGSIQVRDANETLRGYLGYFDANGFGLLNSSGSWGIRLNPGNGDTILYSGGNWKLTTISAGISVNGNVYTNQNFGDGLVGVYSSTRYQGVFAMGDSYKLSADGTSTGTLYGIAWTHTNVGGQSKSGLGHQALFMDNGVTQTAIGSGIWTNGLITSIGYGTSADWNTAYGWGNHASAGYLTSGSLSGYATQSWVNSQGFLTSVPAQSQLISPNGATVVAADSAMPNAGHSFIHSLALGPGGNDGHILGMSWAGTNSIYGAQIFLDTDPNDIMAIRSRSSAGVWTSWKTIYHSGNFTDNSSNWNTAFGWGNHASAGYVTSSALSSYVPRSGAELTEGNYFYFRSNRGAYLGATDSAPLQAYATGGNAAFMSFHRSGNYAVNFGLDSDNIMRIGGWSASADRWVLDMSGNNTVAGSFRAPIFYDSADTSYYLDPNSTSRLYYVNAPQGYVSVGNPWGTANSAYFPNGITTAGSDNWIYGHTYVGNAPTNGSGHEFWDTGKEYHRSNEASSSHGASGRWITRQSANGNYAPYSFESDYGNHSYGVIARYHISNNGGSDRPSITFSSGYNNTRWSVGYCYYDDQFRITQNMGLAPDGSDGTWGTERLRIDTSGILYSGGNAVIHAGNIGSQSVSYASTAGSLTSMNISQFTNNSGYITGISFANVSSKPTTISGYGITDAITTANIGSQSVSYATTAGSAPANGGNSSTVGGYSVSVGASANTIPTRNASGYFIPESWIQLNGIYGLYSPTNGAHLRPNDGSYGPWLVTGTRNGWNGIEFNASNGNVSLMVNPTSNTTGFHNNAYGWQFYWESGTLYCHKNAYGAGAQATVLDSSNYSSWAQPIASAINTGNIGSQSVSYAATAGSTDNIDGWGFVNTGSNNGTNADTINSNGISYYTGGVTNFSGNSTDGALYSQRYSDSWQHQIAGDYRSGMIAVRGRNNGSWTSWRTIIDSSTISSQSVNYASSAGSVAWTNVSSRPTALSQFTNDLGNYGGWITSSGSISGNAATATNVAWSGVTGRPTALSQFSNDLGNYGGWLTTSGKAADSELIDGIDSSQIVYGSGSSKVLSHSNANDFRNSGFYENDGGGSNWPAGSSTWYNSINVRHSNQGNYHGFQVAMSYYDNLLWFRSYQGSGTFQTWAYAISSQNIGSQSVSYATTAGSAGSATTAGSATSAGSVPASGITGQTGMWTSAARPGAYRLYRNDSDDPYNVQTTWAADKANHWSLRGYYNDSYHAPCYVASSGFADNAGQLNTYGYLVGDNWDTYYTSGKLRVASASGATGVGRPPSSVHNYGSLLSYGISGEDMFQMYFPDNAGNSIANSRKLHYRTGRGAWCDWRTVVDMVGDTLTIVEGGTPKIVVRGSVPYGQATSASIELVGDADGGQTQSYRWISNAPDWNGQELRLERKVNNSFQLVGRVPKNTNNLEWQGTIVQGLSDSRVKTNVVSMTEGLDKIDQIRPVTFDWVPTENVSDREGADFGFIAQELEEVLPEVVHTRGDGYKTVMYEKVVPVLVQAMKEQQTMIEALRAEIELLKNK